MGSGESGHGGRKVDVEEWLVSTAIGRIPEGDSRLLM